MVALNQLELAVPLIELELDCGEPPQPDRREEAAPELGEANVPIRDRIGLGGERVPPGDLLLLSIGTYKLSRLIAKDRITSFVRAPFTRFQGESDRPGEVSEEPRGEGLRRAIGELLVCPYCLGQWVGTGFLAAYLREPKIARTVASVFTVIAGSDLLQETWIAVGKRA